MMKYSFVIPTYNNKKLLKNTLEALNYQEGFGKDDYEVIVADDGSNDNTKEYIKGINKNYSLKYIYIERDENSCRSRTRNKAWMAAKGEIIIFIDSDIIVRNNYLKEMERSFSINPNILVFSTRLMLQEDVSIDSIKDGSVFKNNYYSVDKKMLLEGRHFAFNVISYNISFHPFNWNFTYTCNMAISRKFLEDFGGFDENFKKWGTEDIDLGYRASIEGLTVIYNYKLEALHQFHFTNISSNKEGAIENAKYFYNKHPEALSFLPEELRIKLITDIDNEHDENNLIESNKAYMQNMENMVSKLMTKKGSINEITENQEIDFKDKNELSKVKDEVLFSKQPNSITIINDYVEDSDLDIWVQLLGEKSRTIRYFPVSRKI